MANAVTPRINKRILVGLGGGVACEWYDWVIYGLLAAFLGPAFFPGADPVASTLSALAVFALGFVARPIGAAILGPIADRVSHKMVMLISVSTMGVASLLLGILPTYGQIGIWASIIAVVLRLLQGLATGAEAPIANVIAMELAPKGKSGWYLGIVSGSFIQGGSLIASLVAFATSGIFGQSALHAWAWRVPFVVGGLMALAVLYLRRQLPETLIRESEATHGAQDGVQAAEGSVWGELMRHWRPLVAAIFVVGGVQVLNYSWTTGLPNLANATYKENTDAVFGITTLFNVLMVAAGPAVGALADRFGPGKVYSIVRLLGIPTMFLLVVYSRPSIATFVTVMLVGGVVVSANMGLYNYIATSIIPRSCRTTGVGVGYALGVSLFGGTASYLLVFANSVHGIWVFSLYAAVLIGLSVVLYRAVVRRQARIARAAEANGASEAALAADGLPSSLAWTNPGADEDPARPAH